MGEKEGKKSQVQRTEAKPSAKVYIPEREVRRLEQNLSLIDKMEEYSADPSSDCTLLTALKQNHQANDGGTKAEVAQSQFQDLLISNAEFATQEPLEDLQDLQMFIDNMNLWLRNQEIMTNPRHKRMLDFRQNLPAYKMKDELLDLIANNQVVVVSGETGCGKTTQVPQFILDSSIEAGQGTACNVVCTQPRRIAAVSVAERVAEERGEALGESVGFQIRLESHLPRKNGSILFCTTGVVVQWLHSDPLLDNVSHVILDEIHERDIQSDFLITIIRDLLPRRPDLKLILMSATLNAEQFCQYYGNCPMLTIPGFTFPVEEFYLEDVLEMTGFGIKSSEWKPGEKEHRLEFTEMIEPFLRDIELKGSYSRQTIESLRSRGSEMFNVELIASLVSYIHQREKEGGILVFVPGCFEITKLNKLLLEDYQLKENAVIYQLHSMTPTNNQSAIFERPNYGIRKIIIATNIAEISITVDDIVYVVDGGRIKVSNFDPNRNLNLLEVEWVSSANARQRRGRAGRVQPGKCYRLYSRAREATFKPYLPPEMCRSRLEEIILQIKILQLGSANEFFKKVLDPPSEETVSLSLKVLLAMNALAVNCDGIEELTPLGYQLALLPVDHQIGKMILLGAIFCCLDPVLSIAASLSFKEAFVIPPLGMEKLAEEKRLELAKNTMSDHLMMANLMTEWETSDDIDNFCFDYFLSGSVMKMLQKLKRKFARHLYNENFLHSSDVFSESANKNSHNEEMVRAIVCAGLYPNVAKIVQHRNPKGYSERARTKLTSKTDPHIIFHMKSVNNKVTSFPHPWVVYHQKLKSYSVSLHDATVVSPLSLLLFGRHMKIGQDTGEQADNDSVEQADTVSADDYVAFNCSRSKAGLLQRLRRHLDQLLLHKVTYPAPTDWTNSRKEGLVLESIVEVLTAENENNWKF